MLKGYSLPLTPKGKSSLVQPVPHYYGGEVLCALFRVGEENSKPFLPEPLEPYDGGLAYVMVNNFTSVGEDNKEMHFDNPARVSYKEGIIALYCTYKGEMGTYVPYLWVTEDWSMIYGWFFGWSKKIANVDITPLPKKNPVIICGENSKVKGVVHRHGYRLIELSLHIEGKATAEDLPTFGNCYQVRHFPSIGEDIPEIRQLIQVSSWDIVFGDIWKGNPSFKLGTSDNEEFETLQPKEILDGYYYEMGWKGHKAKLLADLNK